MKCCRCGVNETEATVPLEQVDGKLLCASCVYDMSPISEWAIISLNFLTNMRDLLLMEMGVPAPILRGQYESL